MWSSAIYSRENFIIHPTPSIFFHSSYVNFRLFTPINVPITVPTRPLETYFFNLAKTIMYPASAGIQLFGSYADSENFIR